LKLAGEALADSTRALRVLETSHPPTVYVPPDDVRGDLLAASGARSTWCEFKGAARYLDAVVDGRRVHVVAWTYRDPTPAYEALRDHVAFYPGRVDVAWMGTSGCRRKRATSTVAGSPPTSSDRSKDHRKRLVGEPSPARASGTRNRGGPSDAQLWPSESPRLGDLTPALRTICGSDIGVSRGARSSSGAGVSPAGIETPASGNGSLGRCF